jgi:hypothetical protein
MSSTKQTLFFKFFFACMTFLLASLLNSLTIIGFSPGRSEGKRCMATNSNLVCMMTLTLKSDREGKCLLFYHTLTVHIYLTLCLICLYLL